MKATWIISLWALLFVTPQEPTTNSASDIADKLVKFTEEFPAEKVFIHNDRVYYGAGERIWLKSYLVAGSMHSPSPISNNVHVELIAPDKNLAEHILLYSEKGFASGHIDVPDNAPSGTYMLRAYTNWMKNFGDDYFFEKEIEIVAEETGKTEQAKPTSKVQFLPEGGTLVEQVPTRVAFKVEHNQSEIFELFDDQNNSLGTTEIQHDGMGLFALSPEKDRSYYLKDTNGNQFVLPKASSTGFSISANPNLEEVVKITLRSHPNTAEKTGLKAVVHSRGQVSYALDVDLTKNIALFNLPKAQMPEGISHITLFDRQNRPILERLVFIEKDVNKALIKNDKENYGTRSLVKTEIEVTNNAGEPIQGNFSLAAVDASLVPTVLPTKTIKTELLLESDLRGKIDNPTYYFSEEASAKEDLDLLMMTKGWRRFIWQDILNETYPEVNFLIEKGFNVEGKIVDKFNGKPISKGQITYFDNSLNPPLIDETQADADGQFSINNIIVYNNTPVTFQGANRKGRGQSVIGFEINDTIIYSAPSLWPRSILEKNQDLSAFADKSKERQLIDNAFDFDTTATRLDDVVVIGERAAISQEQSAYGAGSVTFAYDAVKTGSKIGRTPLEILQGRVAGVQISGFGIAQTVTIRGGVSGFSDGAPPAFFLNDVPTDLQTILYLSAADIERVEIFKGPDAAIFGANGATGVMAFYTYKGGGTTKPAEGMYTKVIKNAYQGPMEFYAPSYEEKLPEHIKPDRRVLVHWEPMIETDENGKATLEFWTTDNATTIQLDLQGLSNYGKPITQLKTIQVEKSN